MGLCGFVCGPENCVQDSACHTWSLLSTTGIPSPHSPFCSLFLKSLLAKFPGLALNSLYIPERHWLCDSPASAPQVAEVTNLNHQTQLRNRWRVIHFKVQGRTLSNSFKKCPPWTQNTWKDPEWKSLFWVEKGEWFYCQLLVTPQPWGLHVFWEIRTHNALLFSFFSFCLVGWLISWFFFFWFCFSVIIACVSTCVHVCVRVVYSYRCACVTWGSENSFQDPVPSSHCR